MSKQKIGILLLGFCLILFGTIACKKDKGRTPDVPQQVKVTGVSVSPTQLSLKEGESGTLTATVAPTNASNKKVSWSSKNSSIATVSDKGEVKAIAAGETEITATTEYGGFKASAKVVVTKKEPTTIGVTGVTVSPQELTLKEGESGTLTATVAPANATNKKVLWSSKNSSIATVSDMGEVKAIAAGETEITATTEDGGFKASAKVTVIRKDAPDVNVESVTLTAPHNVLKVDNQMVLQVQISPANATNKNVTWNSSDNTIATVENGVVTGKSKGKVTIMVRTEDGGKEDSVELTVREQSADDLPGEILK